MNLQKKEQLSISTQLTRHFGPGALAGIRLGDWLGLLAENNFRVDPRYWGKAVNLTVSSLVTSPVALLEKMLYGPKLESAKVDAPLFVLGSWRSGTTHLHNLLCQDDRFAAPDLFQTMYPHTFRLARWWWEPLLAASTPRKRFMDNVRMSLREPAEDEMAIGILSRKSNSFSWMFPRQAEKYDRYLSFETAEKSDRDAFLMGMNFFVTKVQQAFNRPLILKSPNHTARVELILELYPDAKFVHIHRNPYQVYQSFIHMAKNVIPVWGLQKFDESKIQDVVLKMYADLHQAYFRQRELIPSNQLYELSYDELVANPVDQLSQIYKQLQLPEFEQTRPQVESYLDSIQSYRTNKHHEIPPETRNKIEQHWGFCFEAWGYSLTEAE